jgi:hypothetical protein
VGKSAERRAEARVEVKLVDELKQAHQGNEEGEVCRVQAESARLVWSAFRSAPSTAIG